MNSIIVLLGGFALTALLPTNISSAAAQSEPPITVSGVTISTMGGSANASFNLTNKSSKEVLGYVLVADLFDTSGKLVLRKTEVRIGGPRLGSMGHHSGQTWQGKVTVPISNGQPLNPKIYLDYVRFIDKSDWGPDATRHALKMDGILQGWAMAYSYLGNLLDKQGATAVTTELAVKLRP